MIEPKQQRDLYSGIPWIDVSPEQARGHPKGQLNLLLWAIVAYFLGMAVLKFYLALTYGAGFGGAVLNALWPLLAGLGLALRVPWSVFMAIVSAAMTVYALFRGLGSQASVINMAETIINVGILFYLIDGDRPNLIYRHRYRQYSAREGGDEG